MTKLPAHVREYIAKTRKSKAHFEKAKKALPAGVESNIRIFHPYPFVVKRAEGAYLYDIDGNRYIDYSLGFGPLILGHNHPAVVKAVKAQVDKHAHVAATTELSYEYIKLVRKALPSIELFRFTNSGTEATMHPLRIARAYTGKEKIAKAEGSYHGGYDYVMQSVDIPECVYQRDKKCQPAVPWGKGLPKCISDLTVIYPFNEWPETEEIITKNADELAAVIVEPIHCGGGCVLPRDDYLKKLRKLTKDLGIVLIFDEVLTGFRVSFGGAQEKFGVRPDITCIGKVAGGGYQLGGFGGKKEIMEEILPTEDGSMNVYHGGTYNGHPVSVAAGLATLKILSRPGIYSKIDRIGDSLFNGFLDVAKDRGVDLWSEHIGSLGQIFFTDKEVRTWRDEQETDRAKWEDWFMRMVVRGVFFGVPHPDGHAFTSLVHSKEDIEKSIEAADESFKEIARAGK
jgi:glutamate-1-semialdehyde 2,1-aminomutase